MSDWYDDAMIERLNSVISASDNIIVSPYIANTIPMLGYYPNIQKAHYMIAVCRCEKKERTDAMTAIRLAKCMQREIVIINSDTIDVTVHEANRMRD